MSQLLMTKVLNLLMTSIEVIVPVFNDLSISDTLDHFFAQSSIGCVEITVVDNCSSDAVSAIISKCQRRFPVRYIRHDTFVGFEESFIRAAKSATKSFITFCGAGDLIDVQQLEAAVTTLPLEFNGGLIGGRFALMKEGEQRVQQFMPQMSSPELISSKNLVRWCLEGPLSGLGGWIVGRDALLENLAKLGTVSNTRFPQILLGLSISKDFNVIQTQHCWYIQTSELDPTRQKNAIYRDSGWIRRLTDEATVICPGEATSIRRMISRSIGKNLLSFHVFGGRSTMFSAAAISRKRQGAIWSVVSIALAFLIAATPRSLGRLVISVVRNERARHRW